MDNDSDTDPRLGFGLDSLLVNDTRTRDDQDRLTEVRGDGDTTDKVYTTGLVYDDSQAPEKIATTMTLIYNGAFMGSMSVNIDAVAKTARVEHFDYENRKLVLNFDGTNIMTSDLVPVSGYWRDADGSQISITSTFDLLNEVFSGGNHGDIKIGPVQSEFGQVSKNAFPDKDHPDVNSVRTSPCSDARIVACLLALAAVAACCYYTAGLYCQICAEIWCAVCCVCFVI